jgi:NADP-dependent 3-hydroxy acid dehydrogenase YdfG
MADFGFETTAEEAAMAFASEIKGKTGEPRIHPQLLDLSTFSASDVFAVLMTGVSPGSLGAEAALQIARQQPKLLILTGRNLAKVRETETAIKSTVPDTSIRLLELDLASQKQIKKAAEEVNSYPEPIDVLINSAAILAAPYSLTEDGLESQFGTNHIGHFLFTNLIMGKILQAGKGARIVNVSSRGHRRSDIRWDDYNFGVSIAFSPGTLNSISHCYLEWGHL